MAKKYFRYIPDFDYVSRLPKAQNISDYIKSVWDLINSSNKYFNENEPLKKVKVDFQVSQSTTSL